MAHWGALRLNGLILNRSNLYSVVKIVYTWYRIMVNTKIRVLYIIHVHKTLTAYSVFH